MPAPDRYVYLDYAASAPLRREALDAMARYDDEVFAGANPNSLHTLGRLAAQALEGARRNVASSLGRRVRPSEVAFTGGGSEANFIALIGMAEGARDRDRTKTRVLVSAIEHDSVLDNLSELKRRGFSVDTIVPEADGAVSVSSLEEALADGGVALVSIMLANNETGALQPVSELTRIAHRHGALFHADAIQGYLHVPFDVVDLDADALSVAGHKVGAPASIGALYLKARTPFRPVSHGGGQEGGVRPGTQDVRSALALAAVAHSLAPHVPEVCQEVRAVSDALYRQVGSARRISPTLPDPLACDRLPGIVSLTVEGMESEELILKLDSLGFEVSAASACSSGSLDASHVLAAMGIPRERALGSLRISFDERVPAEDVIAFGDALVGIVGA